MATTTDRDNVFNGLPTFSGDMASNPDWRLRVCWMADYAIPADKLELLAGQLILRFHGEAW